MKKYILQRAIPTKLFMLLSFSIFALVMYQGFLLGEIIYSILFYGTLLLCAFQIASIFYVIFIKKTIEVSIDNEYFNWKVLENKKITKDIKIKIDDIKEVATEINYLTGNIYSSFTITFILNNKEEKKFTDGLLYDFGLKMAEDISIFLLQNNLGHKQDIKFYKLIKELNIDITKEQLFNKKRDKEYYIGVISNNKKEFLSLRLQIEALYSDYKKVEKNANNEYLIKAENKKDSFIYLRSNPIGHFIEFNNVKLKEDVKMLKQMGKQKISLF